MRKIFLILIFCLSSTSLGLLHAQDDPTTCVAAPPSRLEIGGTAIVQINSNTPLNLRDRGSTFGVRVGELQPRQEVTVLDGPFCGDGNNLFAWWEVQTEDGLVGWVAEGDAFRSQFIYFLMPIGSTQTDPVGVNCAAAPPTRFSIGQTGVVDENLGSDVTLREEPSGTIVDYLFMGTEFVVIEGPRCGAFDRTFQWWQIQTAEGLVGWVAEGDGSVSPPRYYIRPSNAVAALREAVDLGCAASPPSILQVGDTVEVTDNGGFPLNVRNNPDGGRIAELDEGTRLTILSGPVCGNLYAWWQIETADGLQGWVAEGDSEQSPVAYFIQLAQEDAPTPTATVAAAQPAPTAIPSATSAPPNTESNSAGTASACRAAPPSNLVVGSAAEVTTNAAVLRDLPSLAGGEVARVAVGEFVILVAGPICGLGDNLYQWWQVRDANGVIGWAQEGDAAQSPPVYYLSPSGG